MTETQGLNHLGLTVVDLNSTTSFFVKALGWEEVARDESYPRTAVTDGKLRLTLWQADRSLEVQSFDRGKILDFTISRLKCRRRKTWSLFSKKCQSTLGLRLNLSRSYWAMALECT